MASAEDHSSSISSDIAGVLSKSGERSRKKLEKNDPLSRSIDSPEESADQIEARMAFMNKQLESL